MKDVSDLKIKKKIVFLRVDFNVPLDESGNIIDDTRIQESLETINYLLLNDAKIIIATHLGRPTEGVLTPKDTVAPIALHLEKILNTFIKIFSIDLLDKAKLIDYFMTNKVCMLENVRCNIGEQKNNLTLAKKYASICDIFINDAWGAIHRIESSNNGIVNFMQEYAAGLLFKKEYLTLNNILNNSNSSSVCAIIGGSKVSTKLDVLKNLITKVDILIVGGGILNTFLLAKNINIGNSLCEKNLLHEVQEIINYCDKHQKILFLATDVIAYNQKTGENLHKNIDTLNDDDMIMDIGINSLNEINNLINDAKFIIWNGPLGVFEKEAYSLGTKLLGESIANSSAYSIAGGGDTIAAINKFKIKDKIDYISTAGGAMLDFLAAKELNTLDKLINNQ